MSNQGGNQGWQGKISTYPSVGRFENEPSSNTLYTKGSSAKFTDNDGRKSIAPYSNHGHLSQEPPPQSQPQPQPQQPPPSSGIVGLRTAPYTGTQSGKFCRKIGCQLGRALYQLLLFASLWPPSSKSAKPSNFKRR